MSITRTGWLKLGYIAAVLAIVLLFVALSLASNWHPLALLLGVTCMLLPGRIQARLLRELFKGRMDLQRHRPAEAIRAFESFLQRLQGHPRLAGAIWLSWPVYTTSLQAMTLNNLAVARFTAGDTTAALQDLHSALRIDPRYAIPYLNLAVLAQAQAAPGLDAPRMYLKRAAQAGYTGSLSDRIVQRGQALLVAMEAPTRVAQ